MSADVKHTNPKDAIAGTKMPLHLWPLTATVGGCLALFEGMLKYGRTNWRPMGVRASVYVAACLRHLLCWYEGENDDPDSGLSHLYHALACLAILVDAKEAGNLQDDRQYPIHAEKMMRRETVHIIRMVEKYKDRKPHHWTIQDVGKEEAILEIIERPEESAIVQ